MPSLRSRCRTSTNGSSCGQPVGDLARPVRRVVVHHEDAVVRPDRSRRGRAASAPGSRARCRWAGRRPRARPYHRRHGEDAAPQRRARRPARAARRPLRASRRGRLPRDRLPPRRAAHPRDAGPDRAARARRARRRSCPGIGKTIEEKIVEVVEDGEMHALARRRDQVPPEVVSFLTAAGPGAEDRRPHLAGARCHDGRRAEGGRRGRAAADARRAWARAARRRSSRRSPRTRRPRGRSAICSASGFRPCRPSSRRCGSIRRPSRSPRPGACGGDARRSATST